MIAVIDYGIGNLRSAEKALLAIGAPARLVSSPDDLAGANGIVLPGVGAYGACMSALCGAGFDGVLGELVDDGVPLLGLCVGFQLLFSSSEESPDTPGLGILPGVVRRLSSVMKLPQMQWNTVERAAGRTPSMVEGLTENPWFYFVHSYAPLESDVDPGDVALTSDYGGRFVAAIERTNLWGTQFHPEKSGSVGLSLLRNFVQRCGDLEPLDDRPQEKRSDRLGSR